MSMPRSEDNDVTVFPTGPAAPEVAAPGESALLPGTTIAEFRILRLIGEGGFGIVYLAHDETLDRVVALKEYMPSQLAQRQGGTLSVQVRSQRHAETFAAGLRSFMNEARLLARFDHPSLLKVHRFFQANGTAYMAMPFYDGRTLKSVLRALPAPPDEAWLTRLLHQLLDALEVIHGHECYHRDISPDNILVLANDTPILLDFGAARRVIGDMTQTLTVILKPGYAPIEQYAEDPDMKQGPWTDLYALASVAYFAIAGEPPVAAISRAMNDRFVPLSQRARGAYSERFLGTIDAALALKPEQRPQSVAQFRAMLGDATATTDGAAFAAAAPVLTVVELAREAPTTLADAATRSPPATGPRSGAVTAATVAQPTAAPPPVEAATADRWRRRALIAGIAAAAPAVVAAAWWLTSRTAEPPAVATEPPGAPKIAIAPTPAPLAAPLPAQPPQQAQATQPEPSPPVIAPPERPRAVPKPEPLPAKAIERTPPPPAKPAEREPPKSQPPRTEAPKAAAPSAEAPKPQPLVALAPPVREAPPVRAEETAEPKPPPQPAARAEPEQKAAAAPPAAKSEPRADKPVELARVDPKPAPAPAEKSPLIGRYTGRFVNNNFMIGTTLVITSVEHGVVTGTATHTGGACAGEYRMSGSLRDDVLRMRSTHSAGRAGDCTFGFRLAVKGNRLVGETGSGLPMELSR